MRKFTTVGIHVHARDWNFGETTGHENFKVTRNGDVMNFVANLSDRTYAGKLTHNGAIWRGVMEYDGGTASSLIVNLVRPNELGLLFASANPDPAPVSIAAYDERGQQVKMSTD
ncbi:hypothetical protein OS189_09105 [Sulfitobacter sp. F26169L]|uniref:hypothetical protein n=1 Tax=Sulfitobacter sp. F26169L TaxID=2996015 RepID=UPI002260B6EF|nr:hypothetical protein [Sulfitobacter sp. F26169L]MCX7566496.1 hypothetical protein [Sulfitobacter sp. F26169L]